MFSRSTRREVDDLVETLDELRQQIAALGRRVGSDAEAAFGDGRKHAHQVKALATDVATRLRGHAGTVQGEISEHPVTSVTAGFVIGLLIGRFFMR
jgi:ElaB/YqjD/DUF883 family membrane-anchored ribosome-binding protein